MENSSHSLLPMPIRTKEADKVYSILGRAVSYATEFETNCRELAHIFEIKDVEDNFDYEIYIRMQNGTLNNKIKKIIREHDIGSWFSKCIDDGRIARNRLVHEIPKFHISDMESDDGRRSLWASIMVEIMNISKANQFVLDLIRIIKENSGKTFGSDLIAYGGAVHEWIGSLSVEQDDGANPTHCTD